VNAKNAGVNVKLSAFVTGFIPKIHTSDIPLSETMLPRKLKPGTELKCKIIQLNVEEKRCVLTAQKTLIKSKLSLIDSFDKVEKGLETYGVVVSIQSYGLLLGFLNDLKGLLPRNEISTSSTMLKSDQDLKELYYIGQIIKCDVLDFNKEKQQIKLSLIMDTKSKKNDHKKMEIEYEIGDLIESANIIQVNEDNHYFRLKLPAGNKHGIIYKNHLSDLECLNDALFDYYKRALKVNNLMITQYSQSQSDTSSKPKSCHYLTLKNSLIEYYTQKIGKSGIPKAFEELKANEWHHGWVKKILANGLLVELPFNIVGFCANQELKYANELRSTNINGLSIGQSLLVRVNKIFSDKHKYVFCMFDCYSFKKCN
jgi:ribosomal protein S1